MTAVAITNISPRIKRTDPLSPPLLLRDPTVTIRRVTTAHREVDLKPEEAAVLHTQL